MLPMSTLKFGDPVILSVKMVADDLSLHVDTIPWAKAPGLGPIGSAERPRAERGLAAEGTLLLVAPTNPLSDSSNTPITVARAASTAKRWTGLPTEKGQLLRERCDTEQQSPPSMT